MRMGKTQRDYYLGEKVREIQTEIGQNADGLDEMGELEQTIKNKHMPALAKEKALKEFKKLRSMPPMSAETTVVRNYIDCIVSLPWEKKSKSKIDINKAEKILDEDHFGLAKPKERILEYLAVQSQVKKIKGPDPLSGRASRRRQDLDLSVHCPGDGPEIRPSLLGRGAGRGRDPRPSPDLHRRHAGQDHSVDAEGRCRQSGVLPG